MKIKSIQIYVGIVALLVIGYSYYYLNRPENLVINFKWHTGSFNHGKEEIKTGLAWTLSSLGAELPNGSLDSALMDIAPQVFSVDLSKVGFTEAAQVALQVVVSQLKSSEAYKENSYTELGRFVMLTLNSSYHYYEITEAPKSLREFKAQYRFEGKQARIINSSVSKVQRLVEVAEADGIEEIAYISTEGLGTFQNGNFTPEEFEVFDIMPNGQLRFALYDKKGRLKDSADGAITNAGKPSKCLWCHEVNIQPFFRPEPILDGPEFLNVVDFMDIRNNQMRMLVEYRDSLKSDIDFRKRQDHGFMEKLYIDFTEPSLERLAEEWQLSLEETKSLLTGYKTHTQEEFKFENLYDRKDVDRLSPLSIVPVPEHPREFSINEPNLFSLQK